MARHGLFADEQLLTDLSIGLSSRQQAQNLHLPLAERAHWLMRPAVHLFGDTCQAGLCVQLLEQSSCVFELETTAVLIAASFTDSSQQQTGLRLFVGHLKITPEVPRLAKRRRCGRNVAFRE